jgi:hydroxyacylglutathione hydrolase
MLEITQFLVGADNYGVLVHDSSSGLTASIDAPGSADIARHAERLGQPLTHIFITHHHGDHTAGNLALKQRYACEIIGPAKEAAKIPGIDRTVVEGDTIAFGPHTFRILETPGHTLGHVAYVCDASAVAFVGDTLFAMGCGRVIEGDYAMMWASLSKLAALPPETRIYCGHEYTVANARFALTIDPANVALQARAEALDPGRNTVPTLLAAELATNPFLRARNPAIAAHLGLAGAPAARVFAEIRDRKNRG